MEDLKTKHSDLIVVVGRKAAHIFDKVQVRWIGSFADLGYVTLADGLKRDGE